MNPQNLVSNEKRSVIWKSNEQIHKKKWNNLELLFHDPKSPKNKRWHQSLKPMNISLLGCIYKNWSQTKLKISSPIGEIN